MDTFGNWLRLSAKSLLSKTEKNSDIWENSDNPSPVNPLPMSTKYIENYPLLIPMIIAVKD